jgi:hypothetical protein
MATQGVALGWHVIVPSGRKSGCSTSALACENPRPTSLCSAAPGMPESIGVPVHCRSDRGDRRRAAARFSTDVREVIGNLFGPVGRDGSRTRLDGERPLKCSIELERAEVAR